MEMSHRSTPTFVGAVPYGEVTASTAAQLFSSPIRPPRTLDSATLSFPHLNPRTRSAWTHFESQASNID
eukprot:770481-Amphidinium_carterae.1